MSEVVSALGVYLRPRVFSLPSHLLFHPEFLHWRPSRAFFLHCRITSYYSSCCTTQSPDEHGANLLSYTTLRDIIGTDVQLQAGG
jgi:hypothetical protein